jgi:hypothetical protein
MGEAWANEGIRGQTCSSDIISELSDAPASNDMGASAGE